MNRREIGLRMHGLNRADHSDLLAIPQTLDRLELRIIFVAARKIIKHVAERLHSKFGERLRVVRSNALKNGQWRVERGGSLAVFCAGN